MVQTEAGKAIDKVSQEILISGLASLNINIESDIINKLLAFIMLMEKWNKTYNLTAIRNRHDMVQLHLLDSLAMLPHVAGRRIIDVGTGAGLPGIPLALCMPDTQFTLLDSNIKKTRFVQQAVLELKLKNVKVCHNRVEQFKPDELYDVIITRAFASLPDIVVLTQHLLADDGVLLAMKAQMPHQELQEAGAVGSIIDIKVPGVDAERCLIKITGIENTRGARE